MIIETSKTKNSFIDMWIVTENNSEHSCVLVNISRTPNDHKTGDELVKNISLCFLTIVLEVSLVFNYSIISHININVRKNYSVPSFLNPVKIII